jgi:UDP-N-acetylglucosamine acyltransferase
MAELNVLCEIAPGALIDPEARIGRWCVVGPAVRIGRGTRLHDRVTVLGRTFIGQDNVIGGGSVIGGEPQDLKYRGGVSWLVIGDRNHIGHKVTLNVGTEMGGRVTYVGNDCVLDDACHVAHDCYLADRVSLGRKVLLGGHILVQTGAVVEAMTGVQPFTRIGRYARVGARTPVRCDVPPYVDYYSEDYYWDPPKVRGLHEAGIAASGLALDRAAGLRRALEELFANEAALATKLDHVESQQPLDEEVAYLCRFCRQSLSGRYGRYRELFRDQLPPEAEEFLPADLLEQVKKEMQCQ